MRTSCAEAVSPAAASNGAMRARSRRASSLRRMGNSAPRASVSELSACAFSFGEGVRGGDTESCAETFIVAMRRENRTTRGRRHMCPPATLYGLPAHILGHREGKDSSPQHLRRRKVEMQCTTQRLTGL